MSSPQQPSVTPLTPASAPEKKEPTLPKASPVNEYGVTEEEWVKKYGTRDGWADKRLTTLPKAPVIRSFKLGKGVSAPGKDEVWTKSYLELEVEVPPDCKDGELADILTSAEYIVDNWLKAPDTQQPAKAVPPPTPPAQPAQKQVSPIQKVEAEFPEDLQAMLNFDMKGQYVVMKPRQFLGSENFAKIASVVRGIGGEYISAGPDSHFRVPLEKLMPGERQQQAAKNAVIITPDEVDNLPWKSFHDVDTATGKKQLVGPGQVGWLFRNEADVRLVQLLEKAGKELELPPYEFKWSGKDNNLIVRARLSAGEKKK